MATKPSKYTIAIDFDGVIHWYRQGWQNGAIYDEPVPGFRDWAEKAKEVYKLVIVSSRLSDPGGEQAMRQWMDDQGIPVDWFEFSHVRPMAFLTIDDRAVQFDGDWSALAVEDLLKFRPWNMR